LTIRVSQVVAEVLVHTSLSARASQTIAEVLVAAGVTTRVSQTVAELLYQLSGGGGGGLAHRVSQIVAEILIWTQNLTTPPIYPTLIGLGYSVIKRPVFYDGKVVSGSGWSVRISYANAPTWEWDLTYDDSNGGFLRDLTATPELKQLLGFYLGMSGDLTPFLFLDPDDNTVTLQPLGTTDGTTTLYTLERSYGSGTVGVEPIGYYNAATPIEVYLDGTLQSSSTYSVITATPVNQQLSFNTAPSSGQAITATFSYWYYVHFKDPSNDFEKFMNQLWSLKKITLESLRG
jgi:hypothetical protein